MVWYFKKRNIIKIRDINFQNDTMKNKSDATGVKTVLEEK